MRARTWLLTLTTALTACGDAAPSPIIQVPQVPPVPPGPTPPDVAAQLRIPTINGVEALEISPDGAYVATLDHASSNKPAPCTVWRTATGEARFTVPVGLVRLGATAAGAPRLVSIRPPASRDDDQHHVEVYDADTGRLVWHDTIGLVIDDLAIDGRGAVLALAHDHSVTRWDLTTGTRLEVVALDNVGGPHLSVSSDGRTLLAGRLLYDLAGHAPLATLAIAENPSGSVELAPDGQHVAVSDADDEVAVLDRRGQVIRTLAHAGRRVQLLADGTLLAFDHRQVTRWDLATGDRRAAFYLPDDTQLVRRGALPLGAGGHAVVRRGDQLAVLQLAPAGPRDAGPIELGRLGLPARPSALQWSRDGQTLAIQTSGLRDDRLDDELDWSVAGALSTRLWPSPPDDPPQRTVEINEARGFVRAPDDHLERIFGAPEPLDRDAALGVRWVAASARSGTVYLWDPDTAEGLGTLAAGGPIAALAIRPDDRTLAVGLASGQIELWDLPSRHRVLDLAVWHGGWIARAPDDPTASPAFALAHPPAARPLAPTPPPTLSAAPCVPAHPGNEPIQLSITGHTLTYCIGQRGVDPACYAAELGARPPRALAPVPPPLDALVLPRTTPDGSYTTEASGAQLDVCDPQHRCKALPIWLRRGPPSAEGSLEGLATDEAVVSSDGAIVVVRRHLTSVIETWDVATGGRIARFPVAFPDLGPQADLSTTSIQMIGHTVVAATTPCAGPCGSATLYDVHGKSLGPLFAESSSSNPLRFHDELWMFDTMEREFDVQDLATGRRVQHGALDDGLIAVGSAFFAVARGKDHLGMVEVFDRAARKIATLHAPFCATRT